MEKECPRCKIAFKSGFSINGSNSEDHALIDPAPAPTNYKTLRLTEVLKCPQCGHAVAAPALALPTGKSKAELQQELLDDAVIIYRL